MGVNVLFAPTADVNNNPDNPIINTRSFGEDPMLVGEMAAAWTRGAQAHGALATLKHERDVFLEIDTYPEGAAPRARYAGMLPPCAAIGSFIHPDFDALRGVLDDIGRRVQVHAG